MPDEYSHGSEEHQHQWKDIQLRFDCSTPRSYIHKRTCVECGLSEELPLTSELQRLVDIEWAAVKEAYEL